MAFERHNQQETEQPVEVVEEFAILGERTKKNGDKETLRFREVKWYGNAPVLDLRWWSENGYAGKGVTFNEDQARKLYDVLKGLVEREV